MSREKTQRFSIRKLTIGAASVVIGAFFVGVSSQNVDASETSKAEATTQIEENKAKSTPVDPNSSSAVSQPKKENSDEDETSFQVVGGISKTNKFYETDFAFCDKGELVLHRTSGENMPYSSKVYKKLITGLKIKDNFKFCDHYSVQSIDEDGNITFVQDKGIHTGAIVKGVKITPVENTNTGTLSTDPADAGNNYYSFRAQPLQFYLSRNHAYTEYQGKTYQGLLGKDGYYTDDADDKSKSDNLIENVYGAKSNKVLTVDQNSDMSKTSEAEFKQLIDTRSLDQHGFKYTMQWAKDKAPKVDKVTDNVAGIVRLNFDDGTYLDVLAHVNVKEVPTNDDKTKDHTPTAPQDNSKSADKNNTTPVDLKPVDPTPLTPSTDTNVEPQPEVPEETPEDNTNEETTVAPHAQDDDATETAKPKAQTVKVAKVSAKKTVASVKSNENTLPQTGSKENAFAVVMGMIASVLAIFGLSINRKKN